MSIAGWIKMPLGIVEIGLGPGHIVLDRDPAPLPQEEAQPQFSAHVCCGLVVKRLDGSRYHLVRGRPLSRPHCAIWGPSSTPQKKGAQSPQFSAPVYCGRMAGWIKMPLGIMEVGLGQGHNVLDGDLAPSSEDGHSAPIFGPCQLWPNDRQSQLLPSTTCYFMYAFYVLFYI